MKVIPLPLRKIKSEMALKGVSLAKLAAKAKVNYSNASAILNGTRIEPESLTKLEAALAQLPMPKEARAV